MRAILQRVSSASVTVAGQTRSRIATGLLILLAVEEGDCPEEAEWLADKTVRLRIFNDNTGVMNQSVQEVGGEIMVVSQFTLVASTRKGNRPSYTRSARPDSAIPLYEAFVSRLKAALGRNIATGDFGAHMEVALVNDGPVTIIIDSKLRE